MPLSLCRFGAIRFCLCAFALSWLSVTAVAQAFPHIKGMSDGAGLSDGVSKSVTKSDADSLTFSEVLTATRNPGQRSINVTDSLRTGDFVRVPPTPVDGLTISDSAVTKSNFTRLNNQLETWHMNDSLSASKTTGGAYVIALTESFHMAELATALKNTGSHSASVSLQDVLVISDPSMFISTMVVGAGERFATTETMAVLGLHYANVAEGVTVVDASGESTTGTSLTRTVVDRYATTDVAVRLGIHRPAPSETAGVADSIAKAVFHSYPEALSEPAGVSDSPVAFVLHMPRLSDLFHQVDTVAVSTNLNHQTYNVAPMEGAGIGDSLAVSVRTTGSKKKVVVIS